MAVLQKELIIRIDLYLRRKFQQWCVSASHERSPSSDGNKIKGRTSSGKVVKKRPSLKSPSDITLYAPALRRDRTVAYSPTLGNLNRDEINNQSVIDQISHFVESIRVRGNQTEERRDRSRSKSIDDRGQQRRQVNSRDTTPVNRNQGVREHSPPAAVEEGRRLADKFILEAEQFKASVQPPKGLDFNDSQGVFSNVIKTLLEDQDDDFFHLTSHLDDNLKGRIELGEFIDLDRLLPKSRTQIMSDADQSMQQFVNRDGSVYWAPPVKESRITNIRQWEQAFRIFAAVYCNANPSRSTEIWQYVFVINTAATSFAWENVYYYDITFRQLMARKPKRSWAKTYTQLWNLAMCDPLNKSGTSGGGNSNTYVSSDKGGGSKHTSWRDRCCWRFNRGNKCRKWNCKYDHRCKECGGYSHNYTNCNKRNDQSSKGVSPDKDRNRSPRKRRRKDQILNKIFIVYFRQPEVREGNFELCEL